MQRVSVYIDGFNLYYGLKTQGWQRYYWLDLRRLADNMLRPGQRLITVKYFTARVASSPQDPDKAKRQHAYLEALSLLPDVRICWGRYRKKELACPDCGATRQIYEEKMTDVNLATELLADAYGDLYDGAVIVSADSDLVRPVRVVRTRFPRKRIIIAFPPGRNSYHLGQAATGYFKLGRKVLSDSQLPERVTNGGYVLQRPLSWQ